MTTADAVDLDNCDREPIHIPGSVQPHGALLACGPDQRILQASVNAADVLGADVQAGMALEDVIGAREAAGLALIAAQGDAPTTATVQLGEYTFDVAVHGSGGLQVLEFEPADSFGGPASFEAMRRMVLRLSAAPSVAGLCDVAAAEVRALTGFDRVMIYRFDENWNGAVVAEDRREDLNPFLGLHYPATDIPAQARALYAANWLRLIADVGYTPAPIVPTDNPLTGRPLDLSAAVLRSVSPVHIEYLSNMGVSASMSISLMHEGDLWGLVACHHYSGPHRPSQPTRAAAAFVGQVMSLLLSAKQRADDYERRLTVQSLQAALAGHINDDPGSPVESIATSGAALLDLVGATGAAIRTDGEWLTVGVTPGTQDLASLADWLWRDGSALVSTASLAADNPALAHLGDNASGVLGVAVTRDAADHVLWFRPEVVQTVDWGGDPQNKVVAVTEDDTVRLSPRKSFELWKQTVKGTALPWSELDREAGSEFGRSLAGALLHRSQETADVARTLQQGLAPAVVDEVSDVSVAARYRTGGMGEVGGDWYDVLELPGGGVAVVIGDVAGHGVGAATTMGHLRHSARAYLLEERSPAKILERLNCLTHWVLPGEIATAVVVMFDADSTGIRISSAGHLPPLAVGAGQSQFVSVTGGPALGVTEAAVYSETEHRLGDESLLLFTDGLVERRGESIDAGLDRLAEVTARYSDSGEFLDRLLAEMVGERADDDLAVLVVRRRK